MFNDPYMVIKRRCVWNKRFPLGQYMLHFTTFIMYQLFPSIASLQLTTGCLVPGIVVVYVNRSLTV